MVMEVSTRGLHNGFSMSCVARHYSEERLPQRYRPKAKPKGTARKGANNGNSVLSDEQVYDIRKKCLTQTQASVAKEYKLSISYVQKIAARTAWAHLPERK